MEELRSFGWYAARISPKLPKEVFKPVPTRLIGGFIHLVIAVTAMTCVIVFDFNVWVNLLLSIVIGSSFSSMGFLGHEILHGTVVRTAWLRDLLGAIAFFPLSTSPKLWRKWHNMNHHIHTQDDDLDPDAWPSITKLANNRFIMFFYRRVPLAIRSFVSLCFLAATFTLHSLRMFFRYINDFKLKKRPLVWLQTILPWVVWFSLLAWIGIVKWMFVFVLPLLIANFIVMSYISTNHRLNPLVPINDPLANSLTVTVPKWVDVLHFNFSYHTEHHLFPGLNPKYYPLVKKLILQTWPERYFEMPLIKAMVTLYKTPRLYHEEVEFIDPHKDHVYDSLGHGLEPDNIVNRTVAESEMLTDQQSLEKRAGQ